MSGNNVTIIGNTTRDAEIRFTPNGQANLRVGVAVNRRWQNGQGEWQEAVSFFDCVAWKDLAENAADSLPKGTRVIVTGRLEQRSYEKDGQQRSVTEIIADDIAPSLRWATAKVTKTEKTNTAPRSTSNYTGEYGDEAF